MKNKKDLNEDTVSLEWKVSSGKKLTNKDWEAMAKKYCDMQAGMHERSAEGLDGWLDCNKQKNKSKC